MTTIDVHDEWDDPRQYRLWDVEDVEPFDGIEVADTGSATEAEAETDLREGAWTREDWERPWG